MIVLSILDKIKYRIAYEGTDLDTRYDITKIIMHVARDALLTHWGRVAHICVNKVAIIGSDNGLSPGRRQAIIWTNDGILLIGPLGTNVSEILIEIQTFSFKKMHLKMSSGKWRPFCLGVNVLIKRMSQWGCYFALPSFRPALLCRHSVAHSRHIVSLNLVNIGSGNGLVPDDLVPSGNKPSPESMLNYYQ